MLMEPPWLDARLYHLMIAYMLLSTGCGSNDAPFLPLDQLCPSIADTVCEAQRACCEGNAQAEADCVDDVRRACDEERRALTEDSSLSYDGERAEAVHDELRAGARACEEPFAIARFFDGTRANGASCDRDSLCAQGACEGGQCATRALLPLCR